MRSEIRGQILVAAMMSFAMAARLSRLFRLVEPRLFGRRLRDTGLNLVRAWPVACPAAVLLGRPINLIAFKLAGVRGL